jgi:3-methyladenine DNA glycosylase AlkD
VSAAVAETLAWVREELRSHIEPAYRAGMVAYVREPIDPYGVRAPEVKRIAAAVYKIVKPWPAAALRRLCGELWKSGKFEEGAIVIYVYRRLRKQFAAPEFALFERWIDRYVRNWAHCDGVSSWLVSGCIENDASLIPRLNGWTRSRNRWKRRAAAVSLLQEAKQGRHLEAIFRIAEALLEDPDDMVQKGVGWLLKETYPKRAREVVRFLEPRRARAPRLLLRYAAEKMTPADRAQVLARG